ncbi:MAG: hypothetical protein DRG40_01070 [Deltaproteobacteria bacterium]|nr:MAG: hypothetical protein DRG40_01070 [Deltaproteobacteria bacterium]
MEDWRELGGKLRELVRLLSMPVAVKLLKGKEPPAGARRPLRDLGVKMAPCQGAAMARRYGWTVAFGREDVGCGIAAHTYGWERVKGEEGAIDFFFRMRYAVDRDAAREIVEGFPLLELGDDLVVVYSPLERTKVEPDVVLIYANPAQMMRLIHGATYHTGKPLGGSFSGRAASCTEGVIGAYLGRDTRVVVPGNGDRVWATCQDDEMILAVHASRIRELVEGLEETHKGGIRYPIPAYLRYQPEVGFTVPLTDIFKPGEIGRFTSKR